MKVNIRYAWLMPRFIGIALLSVAVMFPAAAREPAPVVEGTSQGVPSDLEARLNKIESRSQALVEMLTRLDQMQQEMQTLLGQMEIVTHEIENIKKRQRDLYVDIDRRLGMVEQKASELAKGQTGGQPVGPTGVMMATPQQGTGAQDSGSTAVASVSPQTMQLEREAYERAFNLLKEGRYDLAVASFKAYLETYPKSEYSDNAQYWLGEANYAKRRYQAALQEFDTLLKKHPKSSKRADAMLKMGFSYQELGKNDEAKKVFGDLVKNFPDSTAARLANKRLQSLNRR